MGKYKSTERRMRKAIKKAQRMTRNTLQSPMNGRLLIGFPKNKVVTLRYNMSIQLDATTAATAGRAFRANSCYDPDTAVGGHQPLGFDQWSLYYNHYTVIGSKVYAQFSSASTTNQAGQSVIGIYLADDTIVPTTPSLMIEQGLSKWKYMPHQLQAQSAKDLMITNTFSAKKFFNLTNVKDNQDRIGALTEPSGANPNDEAFFIIYTGGVSGLVDPVPLTIDVTIEYITMFSEPKSLPQS